MIATWHPCEGQTGALGYVTGQTGNTPGRVNGHERRRPHIHWTSYSNRGKLNYTVLKAPFNKSINKLNSIDTEANRDIAQVVSRRRLGFIPRSSHVGFMVGKVALGWPSFEYFGFPANSYSTKCSTFINHLIMD